MMPRRERTFVTLGGLALLLATTAAHAQFPGQQTYCNPLDIDYKYNFEQQARGISFRSGADPVIVNHKGEYFLFVTISGGWWHSKDLVNWRFIKPDVSPHQGEAPGCRVEVFRARQAVGFT